MPNMNLELDETGLFGKFFPTVFLDRIIINYPDNAYGVPDVTADLRFSATMTLNITQPADSNIDIQEWVEHNMDTLSMYVCLSPFSELNTQLEESRLDLKELFSTIFMSGYYASSPQLYNSSRDGFYSIISYIKQSFINNWHIGDGFAAEAYTEGTGTSGVVYTDDFRSENLYNTEVVGPEFWGTGTDGQLNLEGPWATDDPDCYVALLLPWVLETYGGGASETNIKFIRMPLSEVIASGEISEVMYDTEGNKIVEISNIPIEFSYATSTTETDDPATEAAAFAAANSILESTEKLFIVSTVGTSYMLSAYGDVDNNLFNANFGDISYEFLLHNGAPPPQEETVYVKIQTQEIVNSLPIQTRNQKYYEPAPINQQEIARSIVTLISNFEVLAEKDPRLAKNIQNLESLLATHGSSIDLLPKLFKYGASYVGKDRASRPGKFFIGLSQILTSYNNAVGEQAQLSKNLVLNDRVIDRRPPSVSMSYWYPSPLGADRLAEPSAWVFSDTGDDYIPLLWTKMSRYVEQTIPTYGLLSDFVEYAIGEGFAASSSGIVDTGEEIFSEDMISGNSFGSHESEAMTPYTDAVVANKGYWFFDYEKALHMRSNLAQVVNIRRMQDLFHVTVPYEFFRLNYAKMDRNEYELQLQNDPDAAASTWRTDEIIYTSQKLDFTDTSYYPNGRWSTYSYDPEMMRYGQPFVYLASGLGNEVELGDVAGSFGDDVGAYAAAMGLEDGDWKDSTFADAMGAISKDSLWGDTDGTGGEMDIYRVSNYIRWADATEISTRSNSYLRFEIFDIPTNVEEDRLENFGLYTNLDWNADGGHGAGPINGYRLMSFNYRDYMDDDVAYYNTYGSYHGDRNGIVTGFIDRLMEGGTSYIDLIAEYADDPTSLDITPDHDDVWTSYGVSVSVRDHSLKYFTRHVFNEMRSAYYFLTGYQSQASQICSANNITGRFNEFFSEAIEEYYANDGEEASWPWIRAAYMYNAIRDLLFNSFSGFHGAATNMDGLMEQARRDANTIGPHNGSLDAIEAYRVQFLRILTLIDPSMGGDVAYHPVRNRMRDLLGLDPDMPDDEIWEYIETTPSTFLFANTIPIAGQIYGNMSLSAFWENSIVDAPSDTCSDGAGFATSGTDLDDMGPAGWMACVWPTYLAMRAGTNLGSGIPTYYRQPASASNLAGEVWHAPEADPETYWQESVLVQAFINQFRDLLDATLPELPQLGDLWLSADYSIWRTEAWFWPSSDAVVPYIGMEGGPNWTQFAFILTELGLTDATQIWTLCVGWQTLHIGSLGADADYTGLLHSSGTVTAFSATLMRPNPLPYKFGFRPRFWFSSADIGYNWPRTYPAGEHVDPTRSEGYGRYVNKMIYVPDQSWHAGITDHDISSPPILWGLNKKNLAAPLSARGEIRDTGPTGTGAQLDGVVFENGVGFVDASFQNYGGTSIASVIAYQSRLPYNTEEILSIVADFVEALESVGIIIPDADS